MAIRSNLQFNWTFPPGGFNMKVQMTNKPLHPIIVAYNDGRTIAFTVDLYHLLKKLGLRLTP